MVTADDLAAVVAAKHAELEAAGLLDAFRGPAPEVVLAEGEVPLTLTVGVSP